MFLCAAGDAHGRLDMMYQDILAFERRLGIRFDVVLHVGDFGIWPDPAAVDRATRDHEGAGDFPAWFAERRAAPRPTYFIKGNHEDFEWLARQETNVVLPGLSYLPNGHTIAIGDVRVGGIGGCFGPSNYNRPSRELRGSSRRHYTRDEVEAIRQTAGIDILLLHDAPEGVELVKPGRGGQAERRYTSAAAGLREAVIESKPQVCFFGHHHVRVDAVIDGVPCIGLNAIGYDGSLVAITIENQLRWQVIGDWTNALAQ